jgi:hypothetical protein
MPTRRTPIDVDERVDCATRWAVFVLGADESVGARLSGIGLHLPSILDAVDQGGPAHAQVLAKIRAALQPLLFEAA